MQMLYDRYMASGTEYRNLFRGGLRRDTAGCDAVENQHQLIAQAAGIDLAVLGADVGAGGTIEDQSVVAVS